MTMISHPRSRRSSLLDRWKRIDPVWRAAGMTFLASAALFLIGGAIQPGFLNSANLFSILVVASFIGLAGVGQTLVILTGGIDLSVPWVITAGGVMLTTLAAGSNINATWAVPATLAMGGMVGVVNGLGISLMKVPPVVMTLGMNGIMQGLVLWLTNGFTNSSAKAYTPSVISQAMNAKLPGGVPLALVLWALVAVLAWLAISRLTLGRWIYAVGNNPTAAYLAGGRIMLLTVTVYGLCGVTSALTGIVLAGYTGQATLGAGDSYMFSSIAAVVIGGTSILGGKGHYIGTLAGAILLTLLVDVLTLLNIADAGRSILYGLAILAALLLYGRQSEEA
jgi:ribose transport system permease protein